MSNPTKVVSEVYIGLWLTFDWGFKQIAVMVLFDMISPTQKEFIYPLEQEARDAVATGMLWDRELSTTSARYIGYQRTQRVIQI